MINGWTSQAKIINKQKPLKFWIIYPKIDITDNCIVLHLSNINDPDTLSVDHKKLPFQGWQLVNFFTQLLYPFGQLQELGGRNVGKNIKIILKKF